MPETTDIKIVKNTLMNRCIEESPSWKDTAPLLKGTNMWFFIEDDISGSLGAFKTFVKEEGLDENVKIKGGVIDENFVSSAQVAQIADLPPLKDLIAQVRY